MFYPLLKKDTFFTKTKNDGIFFKNNYKNLEIKTSKSYQLFKIIYKDLNGKKSLNEILDSIENLSVQNFMAQLIQTLKDHHFIYFLNKNESNKNLDDLDNLLLFHKCENLTKTRDTFLDNNKVAFLIPEGLIKFDVEAVFKDVFLKIENINPQSKVIFLDEKNEDIKYNENSLYVYQIDNQIIVANDLKSEKNISAINREVPQQALFIILSIISFEIFLYAANFKNEIFKEKYIFNLESFSGGFEKKVKEQSC